MGFKQRALAYEGAYILRGAGYQQPFDSKESIARRIVLEDIYR